MVLIGVIGGRWKGAIPSPKRKGMPCYEGVAAVIDGNGVAAVIAIPAKVTGVEQVGSEGPQLGDKRVEEPGIGAGEGISGWEILRISFANSALASLTFRSL